MIGRLTIIYLLVSVWTTSSAQNDNGMYSHNVEALRIGWEPTALLSKVPMVQVVISKGINQHIEPRLKLGAAGNISDGEPVRGVALGPELRVYGPVGSGLYMGVGGDFRWTRKQRTDYVSRYGGAYSEFFSYRESNRYLGCLFTTGHVMDYGRLCIDVGLQSGFSWRFTKYSELPEDVAFVNVDANFNDLSRRRVTGETVRHLRLRFVVAVLYEL